MKVMRFVMAAALGLAMVGCGAGSEGDNCEKAGDCNDDLVCAYIAVCASGDCPGICGVPCATNDDCSEGICGESIGGQRICQNSRTEATSP